MSPSHQSASQRGCLTCAGWRVSEWGARWTASLSQPWLAWLSALPSSPQKCFSMCLVTVVLDGILFSAQWYQTSLLIPLPSTTRIGSISVSIIQHTTQVMLSNWHVSLFLCLLGVMWSFAVSAPWTWQPGACSYAALKVKVGGQTTFMHFRCTTPNVNKIWLTVTNWSFLGKCTHNLTLSSAAFLHIFHTEWISICLPFTERYG